MNIPYNIEVYDNLISNSVHLKLWEHIRTLEFYGTWAKADQVLINYCLDSVKNPYDWMMWQSIGRSDTLHRVPLASDEAGLKSRSVLIYLLWQELNKKLGNKYQLTGNPEGMSYSPMDPPIPEDPLLLPGWRAYINATYHSQISRGLGYAHRDTPLESNDDSTVTMIYFANPEWYPSWGAEIKFYPEDPTGSTGDHQQFNAGIGQTRDYNIGWLDKGQVVSPVPGRLLIYDGRCLHSTVHAGGPYDLPNVKIVFRAKRISA